MIYVLERSPSTGKVSGWVAVDLEDFTETLDDIYSKADFFIWNKRTGRSIVDGFGGSFEDVKKDYPELSSLWDVIEANGLDAFYYSSFDMEGGITPDPIPKFEKYVEIIERNSSEAYVFKNEKEASTSLNHNFMDDDFKNKLRELLSDYGK